MPTNLHNNGSSAAVCTQTASFHCVAELTHSLSFRRDGACRHPGLQHTTEGARAAGRCLQPLPSIRPQNQFVRGWPPCCRIQQQQIYCQPQREPFLLCLHIQ